MRNFVHVDSSRLITSLTAEMQISGMQRLRAVRTTHGPIYTNQTSRQKNWIGIIFALIMRSPTERNSPSNQRGKVCSESDASTRIANKPRTLKARLLTSIKLAK